MMIQSHSRSTPIALVAAVLLISEFSCCGPSVAQTTSTWTGAGTENNWTDPANWDNNPSMEAYPDNNGGGNFNVEIPRGRVTLDDNITISALSLGVNTAEGGFVTGGKQLISESLNLIGTRGGFDGGGGTFTAQSGTTVVGGFVVDGWTVNANGRLTVGAAGSDGSVNVEGGGRLNLNQGLLFRRNGSISSPASGAALMVNGGDFRRTSSAGGQSSVSVDFIDQGAGTIGNVSGTLLFSQGYMATLNGSKVDVSGGTMLFGGKTTINGGLTVSGNSAGTVRFGGLGAEVTLNGTLAAQAGAAEAPSVVFAGNKFSGGTLNLGPAGTFIHSSGSLGVDGRVTNTGRYQWQGGEITGMGLVNENSVAGQTLINSVTQKTIQGGALTNMGHVTQQNNIGLGADGKVINSQNATYLLQNGIINRLATLNSETGFFNQGTLESAGNSLISAPLTSSKTLLVSAGTLKLNGPSILSGTLGIANQASLEFGFNEANLTNVTFAPEGLSVPDQTTATFTGATVNVFGEIRSQGIGEIVYEAGMVRVRSGDSATFEFDDSAPFVFNASPILTRLQLDGGLTNNGKFVWKQGRLLGSQPLKNAEAKGLIEVSGIANVGDTGDSATIENDGVINITSPQNEGLVLHSGSRLVNNRTGDVDFVGDGSIKSAAGTIPGRFDNSGILGKVDGSISEIAVPFTQDEFGVIDVRSGQLWLRDTANLQGRVELFPTEMKPEPSLLLTGPSVTNNVVFQLDAGGVQYAGGTHTLRGTLRGSGAGGKVLFTSGTIRSDGAATLAFRGATTVQHSGGTLEGPGTVVNDGNYLFSGGVIANGPPADPNREPDTGFTNERDFVWTGGAIRNTFRNSSLGKIMLSGTRDKRIDSGSLVNRGRVTHVDGELQVAAGAKIVNDTGFYIFAPPPDSPDDQSAPSIVPSEQSGAGVFENSGTIIARNFSTLSRDPQIRIPFENKQGEIQVESGASLTVSAGYSLGGGMVRVASNGRADFRGGGFVGGVEYISDGSVSHSGPTLFGSLRGEGAGNTIFRDSTVNPGPGVTFDFDGGAEGGAALFGDANLFGSVTNSGNLTIAPIGGGVVRFVPVDASGAPIGGPGSLTNTAMGALSLVDVKLPVVKLPPNVGFGEIRNDGALVIASITNGPGLLLNAMNLRNGNSGVVTATSSQIGGDGAFDNFGTFVGDPGNGNTLSVNVPVDNQGTITAMSGRTFVSDLKQLTDEGVLTGGRYVVKQDASLVLGRLGVGLVNRNLAEIELNGATATIEGVDGLQENQGDINVEEGATLLNTADAFTQSGTLNVSGPGSSATFSGPVQFDGNGSLTDNAALFAPEFTLGSTGTLRVDDSTLTANLVTNEGTFNIGSSPGLATIAGNYMQTGTLEIEIGGLVPGIEFDLLKVTGFARFLDPSVLEISVINGFVPQLGDSFVIAAAAEIVLDDLTLQVHDQLPNSLAWAANVIDLAGNRRGLELSVTRAVVPEPSTQLLFLTASILLTVIRRLRMKRSANSNSDSSGATYFQSLREK